MISTPWTIRAAQSEDIRAIAEFQTACWRDAYAGLVPADYLARVGVETRGQRWRERWATGVREIAVATQADRVVGVVSWARSEPTAGLPSLELKSLYVARDHHGMGLARELLGVAIADRAAWLWVFEANARAVAFYAKHGFSPDGHRQVDPDTGVEEIRLVRTG